MTEERKLLCFIDSRQPLLPNAPLRKGTVARKNTSHRCGKEEGCHVEPCRPFKFNCHLFPPKTFTVPPAYSFADIFSSFHVLSIYFYSLSSVAVTVVWILTNFVTVPLTCSLFCKLLILESDRSFADVERNKKPKLPLFRVFSQDSWCLTLRRG